MQSLEQQKALEKEKNGENSKGFPCHASSSPTKTNIDASNTPTTTKKPTYLLIKKNGEVLKPTQVFKVVVKPQIPACIKATDVSSLLDQFLEYEQNQNSSATLVKGSSVMLTPVSSPGHLNKPKFTGLDCPSNQSPTAQTNGLTPPVSPPSENNSIATKLSMTSSPSLAKNLTFSATPTKSTVSNTQSSKTNGLTAATSVSNKPSTSERNLKLTTPTRTTDSQNNTEISNKIIPNAKNMFMSASTIDNAKKQTTTNNNTVAVLQKNPKNGNEVIADSMDKPSQSLATLETTPTNNAQATSQNNELNDKIIAGSTNVPMKSSPTSDTSTNIASLPISLNKSNSQNGLTKPHKTSAFTATFPAGQLLNTQEENSIKIILKTLPVNNRAEMSTKAEMSNENVKNINESKTNVTGMNTSTNSNQAQYMREDAAQIKMEIDQPEQVEPRSANGHPVQDNTKVEKSKEITKMEIDQPRNMNKPPIQSSIKTEECKEIPQDYYPRKTGSSQAKTSHSTVYKIPKREPSEAPERKRHVSSDDDDDKDDYYNYKRRKFAKDECYWTSSDDENDDNPKHHHRTQRKQPYTTKRRSSRDSSSNSDDDHDRRRRYTSRKYERRHAESRQSRRSRSPHKTSKNESDDDGRHKRDRRNQNRRKEKKSPLKEDSKESDVHLYDIENERKKNFKLDRTIKETSTEKRKIVYIGNIEDSMTKATIWAKFRKFGPIDKTTVHYRNDGDNYAFVTFVDAASALEAIEEGKRDSDLKHLDICFGGRRKFCGGSYVDFDSTTSSFEEQQEKGARKSSSANEAMDFDTLLQMALKNKKR